MNKVNDKPEVRELTLEERVGILEVRTAQQETLVKGQMAKVFKTLKRLVTDF